MRSTAKNVTVYLDEVPAERRAALARLRELCCARLKGFEESMMYGGPCYSRNGEAPDNRMQRTALRADAEPERSS